MSERITFTADDDTLQIIDAVEQREDIDSTAGAVRQCITDSAALQQRVETLQRELAARERDLDAAEARQDELRTMLKAANRRNDETQALVRYVEERKKGRLTRAKEWLFGRED